MTISENAVLNATVRELRMYDSAEIGDVMAQMESRGARFSSGVWCETIQTVAAALQFRGFQVRINGNNHATVQAKVN